MMIKGFLFLANSSHAQKIIKINKSKVLHNRLNEMAVAAFGQ
jgi:hypothetical protein